MIVLPPVFNAGDTVYLFFDTYDSAGASVTITGLAVTDIEVYKNGSVTQRSSDNGYALLDTDGIDFDSATGLHGFSIDTSDNSDAGFWADGSQYLVHVNAVTIDSQTVRFSYLLTLGFLLRPTTAGRKLDVSSGGEAGVDWANVGSPTTTVNLTGTTVKTATDVETDTADIQSRLPAALGANGNIKADVRDYSGTAGTFSGGRPEVNVSHWSGTAVATVDTAGYPVVTVKDGTGQGELNLTSGRVDANLTRINGSTWLTSAAQFGVNVVSTSTGAIGTTAFAEGAISIDAFDVGTGLRPANSGTAQAGGNTSITLRTEASATDSFYVGQRVYLTSGTGAGQDRIITAYNGTTKVATVDHAWATNPDNTTSYAVKPDARADVETVSLDATAADNLELAYDGNGYAHTGNTYPWTVAWDAEVQSEVQDALDADTEIAAIHTAVTSGTHGNAALKTLIDAVDDLVDTEVAAIKTAVDTIDGIVDSILVDTTQIKADLPTRPTKGVALSNFQFPMLDTDGAAATGVTVTARIAKDGGAYAACTNAVSEVSLGTYRITLTSTEMNADTVKLLFTATGCRNTDVTIVTGVT